MVTYAPSHLEPADWHVLGHEVDAADPRVARRRLDVPIPYDKSGLFTLAHRLAGLSQQLQQLGHSPESDRLVVGDAMRQIDAARRGFLDLGKEFDKEYAELIAPKAPPAPNIKPFRNRARTRE